MVVTFGADAEPQYGDPLAPSRQSRSSIFTEDARPGRDWADSMLRAAEEEGRRRREEEERQRREEAARRQMEQQRRLEEEQDRRADAERASYESARRGAYFERNKDRDSGEVGNEYDAKEEARLWVNSPVGQNFLYPGKGKRLSDDDDPFDLLLKHPDVSDRFKAFYTGDERAVDESMADLRSRGIGDRALGSLVGYFVTPEGQRKYRPMGTRDLGSPIEEVVADTTGSRLLGQLAGGVALAIPGLGAANATMSGAQAESGRGLAMDALGVVGGAIVMGRGVNTLENMAVKKALGSTGGNALARLGVKAGTRAALNIAEDTPLTAAQLVLAGIDPTSPEGLRILGQQAALSGAAGAAVPVVGSGFGGLRQVPGAREVAAGAAGYTGATVLGADEEDARLAALGAAGLVGGRRVPGIAENIARLAARTGIVPEGGVPLAGMIRTTDEAGNARIEAEPTDVNMGREQPVSSEPPNPAGYQRELNPPAPPRAPTPPPPDAPDLGPARVQAEMDDALERGRAQVDANRAPSVPGTDFLDPARRLKTAGEKLGHGAWVAGENMVAFLTGRVSQKIREVDRILAPLLDDVGPGIRTGLGRISAQDAGRAAGILAPPAIGYGLGSLSGDEDRKKQGLVAGLAVTGALSQGAAWGRFRKVHADLATWKPGNAMPEVKLRGDEKFIAIIENPELYDLSKLPPGVSKALIDLQVYREAQLKELNDYERAAGLPVTPKSDFNSMFHQWDQKSLKKALLSAGKVYEKPEIDRLVSSGLGSKEGPVLARGLRDQHGVPIHTLLEAKRAYPGLRLEYGADPKRLLRAEFTFMARRMGDATTLRGLQSDPAHYNTAAIESQKLQAQADAARKGSRQQANLQSQADTLKKEAGDLRVDGWQAINGTGDGLYSPEVGAFVKRVFTDGKGSDSAFVRFFDRGTTELRQLIYTGDLSAWSMQGLMAALQSPATTLRNFHHLAGASLMGEKYLDWFISRNLEAWKKFQLSGGMSGKGLGVEGDTVTTLASAPGLRHVESRGFQAFLPIMRFAQWQNGEQVQAMMQKLPSAARNSYVGPRLAEGALFTAKYGAAGAAAYTADGFVEEHGGGKWEQALAMAMAGGVTALGAKYIQAKLGTAAYGSLAHIDQIKVDVRAAKMTNRSSGIINRPQAGITPHQAQIERIIFRSPALLRNSLTMVKLALFNAGPEGAAASFYLARTGLLMAAAVYGTQQLQGENPSLDPTDSDSPLNPRRFGRADLGLAGSVAAANPWVSLASAVFKVPQIEGDDPGSLRLWTPKSGLSGVAGWFEGRTSDLLGTTMRPVLNQVLYDELGLPRLYSGAEDSDILNPKRYLPVSAQKTIDAGALEGVMPGVNLAGDPAYNTWQEKLLGPLAGAAGLNYTPESRPAEAVRRTEAGVREQFPETTDYSGNARIDRMDLNSAQREQFDTSPVGRDIRAFKDETDAQRGPEKETQVDKYMNARAFELDAHVARLRAIEALPKLQWKKAYSEEQTLYRERKATLERTFANQYVTDERGEKRQIYDRTTGKATTMTVTQYLARGDHPEDQKVDDYYALFEKYTKLDGSLDFDRLEEGQQRFLKGLTPSDKSYVEGRLAGFANIGVRDSTGEAVALPTLKEYENVKELAKPFWELRDKEFTFLQSRDKFFQQFTSYSDFRDQVSAAADQAGVPEETYLSYLSSKHRQYKRFTDKVTKNQRTLRGASKELDFGLQDFYDRPAVNWKAYIANQYGDTRYDAEGPRRARSTYTEDARTKMRFAERYGTQALGR